ncbi:MAG: retron Ec67 family RNA-directed DNA polymerase/endonuclease [Pseudomonadota bacterium]
MTFLSKLKKASSLYDLAVLIGVKPSTLAYALYKTPAHQKYTTFTILKKAGGQRTISAPNARLKFIQRRLADLLEKCQLEIEATLKVKQQCVLAHGFKSGFSIQTNAVNHRNQRWVLNADLANFFPSINFGRVYGFFVKNQHYLLNEKVAAVIAQIACHENKLPQGSPCSPIISNIIAHLLDIRLNELASGCGCTYTRYADDLTFSTNEKSFPRSIAKREPLRPHVWTAGASLTKRVKKIGFEINHKKTRMQYCDARQEATGLVVNRKVNVKKEYYKLARAMCWELITKGAAFEVVNGVSTPVKEEKLRSMLAFIYHVKRWEDERQGKSADDIKKSGFHRLYADFLNYIWFFGQTRTTIVCEGKTDNVYIRCAIRSLATQYPSLVQVSGKKRTLLVQLFKFTKTAQLVQNLSGGR